MYKRVLLKLSGEALSGNGQAFDPEVLAGLAKELKEIQQKGVELAIVVGGGNFIRGKMLAEMGMNRAQGDYMGMLGTVINALAVQNALENAGVDTRVQTAVHMQEVAEPFIFTSGYSSSRKRSCCNFWSWNRFSIFFNRYDSCFTSVRNWSRCDLNGKEWRGWCL